MVHIDNIYKSYEDTDEALKGVSCTVDAGELFGFIGPDGAGKTTLFRILTTLLLADKGQASVDGLDVVRGYKTIRSMVGYMPGRFSLYQDLSVEENLEFFAGVFGTTVKENIHLVEDIYRQLEPFKKRRAGKLSGGMKQKLALCCALIHKPKVLFLDEPTTGVDAVSRKEFWQMLDKLRKQGMTILVSTPYMDEAAMCDRVALMQKGRILSIDAPAAIEAAYPHTLLAIKSPDMYKLLTDLEQYPPAMSSHLFGEYIHLSLKKDQVDQEDLLSYLDALDHPQVEMKVISAGIEDCFMNLMEDEWKMS